MSDINKQIFSVDTSIARPHDFQIFRGETMEVECRFSNYIDPLDLTGSTAVCYWRSPDMASGSSWYTGDATVSGDTVEWLWSPSADSGADEYEWFIRVAGDGTSYRAFGRIGILESPSVNPAVGPVPQSDYYNKGETDGAILAATSALANVSWVEGAIITGTSGKADASALSAYLPTSGGTVGNLSAANLYVNDRVWAEDIGANTVYLGDIDDPIGVLGYDGNGFFLQDGETTVHLSSIADRSDLARYLPLSGGELTGELVAASVRVLDGETEGLYVGTQENYARYFRGGVLRVSRYGDSYGIAYPAKNGTFALSEDVVAATSGKADRSDLSLYLPASGGTVSGPLAVNASVSAGPATIRGELVTQGVNRFTQPLSTPALYYGNGAYLLVPANAETDTIATRGEIRAAVGSINAVLDAINGEVI